MAMILLLALLVGVVEVKVIEKRANVCYGTLGCFSTDPPFTSPQRPVSMAPESPDKIQTKFELFTKESKTVAQTLDARHPENVHSVWTNFKVRPTKFIVHGFLDSPKISPWLKDMKDEMLKNGDYNVVIVDWSGGNAPPYGQATANTRIVGAQIGEVIKELLKSPDVNAASFHIIGHSLGSHICGYVGDRVPGLGRISGLDPAGPYFENTDKIVRLDPDDAVFVDVVHSDAVNLLQLGFGLKEQVGDVDFFPNLGHDQPGCTRDPLTNLIENGLVQGVEEEFACNHLRSIKFYTESINTQCPYYGFPCASEDDFKNNLCHSCTAAGCARLGFHSDEHKPADGKTAKYYLSTGDHAPFCRYHLDVSLKFSSSQGAAEKGTVNIEVTGDKGKSGKIPLMGATSPVNFQAGHTYKFYVMVPADVGSVQSVTFSWTHSFSILDPFGLQHPTITLDEIDIFREEEDADVHLCAAAKSIESGQSLTVNTKC